MTSRPFWCVVCFGLLSLQAPELLLCYNVET